MKALGRKPFRLKFHGVYEPLVTEIHFYCLGILKKDQDIFPIDITLNRIRDELHRVVNRRNNFLLDE